MIVVTNLAFVMLAAATLLTLWRLVKGPTVADRVVSTDLFLTFLVMGIAVGAARTGEDVYLGAMLVVAVVGFLGTAMVARYIERRGA